MRFSFFKIQNYNQCKNYTGSSIKRKTLCTTNIQGHRRKTIKKNFSWRNIVVPCRESWRQQKRTFFHQSFSKCVPYIPHATFHSCSLALTPCTRNRQNSEHPSRNCWKHIQRVDKILKIHPALTTTSKVVLNTDGSGNPRSCLRVPVKLGHFNAAFQCVML